MHLTIYRNLTTLTRTQLLIIIFKIYTTTRNNFDFYI